MTKKRNLEKYLKQVNFDKQYKKLIKKYRNREIVIYGAGQLFQLINNNYDLSKLNIVGICDRNFENNGEEYYCGYKKLLIEDLVTHNTDLILTATFEYLGLIDHLRDHVFKRKKVEYRPMVYMPFWMFIKECLFGVSKKDFI